MFPINWNDAFRKKDGSLGTMEEVGGSSLPEYSASDAGKVLEVNGEGKLEWGELSQLTPDYENKKLLIGIDEGFQYYVPMSKEYVGDDFYGYEIKTNPESTSSVAMIDLYEIVYSTTDGVIYSNFIKTLVHNGDKDYSDDNISITYSGSEWSVTCKVDLYDTNGDKYTSPIHWTYAQTVDYKLLTEDPV